jgi:predicted DNA-binding antitoxin AbrB/MazE fold protein
MSLRHFSDVRPLTNALKHKPGAAANPIVAFPVMALRQAATRPKVAAVRAPGADVTARRRGRGWNRSDLWFRVFGPTTAGCHLAVAEGAGSVAVRRDRLRYQGPKDRMLERCPSVRTEEARFLTLLPPVVLPTLPGAWTCQIARANAMTIAAKTEEARFLTLLPPVVLPTLPGAWTCQIARANAMTIAAKYENGVFKPLEDVTLSEGARVEVHVPADAAPMRRTTSTASPIRGQSP